MNFRGCVMWDVLQWTSSRKHTKKWHVSECRSLKDSFSSSAYKQVVPLSAHLYQHICSSITSAIAPHYWHLLVEFSLSDLTATFELMLIKAQSLHVVRLSILPYCPINSSDEDKFIVNTDKWFFPFKSTDWTSNIVLNILYVYEVCFHALLGFLQIYLQIIWPNKFWTGAKEKITSTENLPKDFKAPLNLRCGQHQ